jgi:AcrR family transcriptional regulator
VRTRESLRRALLDLLQIKPLEQITIRDLAATANIGYTTFFRHHPTKEALLNDVAAEQIGKLIELSLPMLGDNNTRAASMALCTYVAEHRDLWSTLLTGGAAGALREEFVRLSMEVAATRADPKGWLSPDIAAILVASSTIELLAWWLRQEHPVSVERLAEIHDRLVIAPTVHANRPPSRVAQRPKVKTRT